MCIKKCLEHNNCPINPLSLKLFLNVHHVKVLHETTGTTVLLMKV